MSICDHKGRGWGRREEGLFWLLKN
jgi:hypothetical protein